MRYLDEYYQLKILQISYAQCVIMTFKLDERSI